MEGYRFLVCCVLVLTICELGATEKQSVIYQCDPGPITESKKDQETINVTIKFFFLTDATKLFHDGLTFTVVSPNSLLTIVNPEINVPALDISEETKPLHLYTGKFVVKVLVTTHTDGVLTGDLRAELSCDNDLCNEPTPKVIVKETESECVH